MDKIASKISKIIEESEKLFKENEAAAHLVDDEKQNEFLNDLNNYPHAYVLACLMDRQIKAERAWAIPYKIYEELNSFDIKELKKQGEEYYKKLFNDKKLHIYNNKMSKIFYSGVCRIIDKYNSRADNIWKDNPSSSALVYRFLEFDGCGVKIATMAANILVRQFKIKILDKYSIDISPDVHIKRVLWRLGFVDKNADNDLIIYKAREINPTFPGLIDFACWKIGREYCRPNFKECECSKCFMNEFCPKNK